MINQLETLGIIGDARLPGMTPRQRKATVAAWVRTLDQAERARRIKPLGGGAGFRIEGHALAARPLPAGLYLVADPDRQPR